MLFRVVARNSDEEEQEEREVSLRKKRNRRAKKAVATGSRMKRSTASARASVSCKKRNPRKAVWNDKDAWYDLSANEGSLLLSGSLKKKLKKCV